MTSPTPTEVDEFANALQLCIKSRIKEVTRDAPDTLAIVIDQAAPDDTALQLALQLLPGAWNPKKTTYRVALPLPNPTDIPLLTQFFWLTRLQRDNMQHIAAANPRYRPIAEQLGLTRGAHDRIDDPAAARDALFAAIAAQHLTLRVVAERSGVTQVTLSKFKAGGDIMLSTFLKIATAVGWTISYQAHGTQPRRR